MRAYVKGPVVSKREKPWEFNGRSGISYQVFVRDVMDDPAAGAQLIKVTPRQYAEIVEGDVIENVPVNIYANTIERGGATVGARITVSLPEDYSFTAGAGMHAVS